MKQKYAKYVVLTFMSTYIFWFILSYLISSNGVSLEAPSGILLYFLGGFSSTLMAYVVISLKPKESIRKFHQRIFSLKLSARDTFLALLMPIAIVAFGQVVFLILEGKMSFEFAQISWYSFPVFFLVAIIFGGIEEIGWRGIVQNQFPRKFTLVQLNLFLGTLWAFWHLPLFFMVGVIHSQSSFFAFWLSCIGYSSFMTYQYAKTRNVFFPILFHTMLNALGALGVQVPMNQTSSFFIYSALIFLLGSFFLFSIDKRKEIQ